MNKIDVLVEKMVNIKTFELTNKEISQIMANNTHKETITAIHYCYDTVKSESNTKKKSMDYSKFFSCTSKGICPNEFNELLNCYKIDQSKNSEKCFNELNKLHFCMNNRIMTYTDNLLEINED